MSGRGTVIFDFDGTLFRLPVDWAEVRTRLGLGAGDSITEHMQAGLDGGEKVRADAVLAVLTEHERAAVRYGRFLAGALDVLGALAAEHNLAVLTRNSRHCVLDALQGTGLGTVLVVGREDVRRLKPDPEGVHAVLAHYEAPAGRCVLVGDTFHDVQAANAAGVSSVVVHNEQLTYVPQGADRYANTLATALDAIGDLMGAGLR